MNDQDTSQHDAPPDQPLNGNANAPQEGPLSGKTTQLAMGAAATIGIMILYKLRAKMLAKEDPETYAQVREISAAVRHADKVERSGQDRRKHRSANQASSDRRGSERREDVE